MPKNRGRLFEALRNAFPDAKEERLEDQANFFSTPFSIEPRNLAAADLPTQKRELNKISEGLYQLLVCLRNLHPKVRLEFENQFRSSLEDMNVVAPGVARTATPRLYSMLATSYWATTGRYPRFHDAPDDGLPVIESALQKALIVNDSLIQVTQQSGGRRGTLDRVGLVDHVWSVWRKYTDNDPRPTGKEFLDLLTAFIDEFEEWLPDGTDARKSVDTYISQKKTSLKGATKN